MVEKTQMTSESISFELAIEKLQTTVKKLETGELSLEESLKNFEEGVRLTKYCQEMLKVAEQKVEILMQAGNTGNEALQPFRSNSG